MFHVEHRRSIEIDVPRETCRLLERLVDLVLAESARQNLVAASTFDTIWHRHIVDSVQLDMNVKTGPILDIGSGAGFPGLVLAILTGQPTVLVEPRRKRADFLTFAAVELGIFKYVEVVPLRVERLQRSPFPTITARAVAALDTLFGIANHLSSPETRWILPKGRTAREELDRARGTWQGDFRLVPSITDPEASIVVAEQVRRRAA